MEKSKSNFLNGKIAYHHDIDDVLDGEQISLIDDVYDVEDEEEEDEDDFEDFKSRSMPKEFKNINCPAYELVNTYKLEEGEKPLSKVVGHENQKKELLLVIDWFNHCKELKEKGVSIPKGVILFGEPGNGKSLLIKEIIRCINSPVFIFKGDCANIVEGIYEVFAKAREKGHSIIVIDELDLLIDKDRRVTRALQENLDGVESYDDILVLTATNSIRDIPNPLIREGRLEKLIRVPNPDAKEAVSLFKKYMEEFKVKLPDDYDEDELGLSLSDISCAGIKSVVNDLVLRNGFENITVENIDDSIVNITRRVKDRIEEDNIEVAVHEAGHALMAKAYSNFFYINKLNINGAGGDFQCNEVEKGFWPYDKVIAHIKIAMAGVIAQKVIFNRGSLGCDEDLQTARSYAYSLFNCCGYSSCWETLPRISPHSRIETSIKRRKNERKIEALLRKCEKETTKYIIEHKDIIYKLGEKLFEKKHLKSSEILSVIG